MNRLKRKLFDEDGRSVEYGPNVTTIGPAPARYAQHDARTASLWILGQVRGGAWSCDTDPAAQVTTLYKVA